MSQNFGNNRTSISRDHKPSEVSEQKRIIAGGGKVYQSNAMAQGNIRGPALVGPMRVMPGRLSVSRTFGDCIAKMEKYGGNPKCIVADADIFSVKITDDLDYVLIGSDGIFDRISTIDTCGIVQAEVQRLTENMRTTPNLVQGSFEHVSNCCGEAVDCLLM